MNLELEILLAATEEEGSEFSDSFERAKPAKELKTHMSVWKALCRGNNYRYTGVATTYGSERSSPPVRTGRLTEPRSYTRAHPPTNSHALPPQIRLQGRGSLSPFISTSDGRGAGSRPECEYVGKRVTLWELWGRSHQMSTEMPIRRFRILIQ